MIIKTKEIRDFLVLAVLFHFFAVAGCSAGPSEDVWEQIGYLQQQVSSLLPLAQEDGQSQDVDEGIKNKINSLNQQAENISSQWQSVFSNPPDTTNADMLTSGCDNSLHTDGDCLQQTNVVDGYGDDVAGGSSVVGFSSGIGGKQSISSVAISGNASSFGGDRIINKGTDQIPRKLTRSEISAEIIQIKLLLVQLIQQLIVELQKQLAAAR